LNGLIVVVDFAKHLI